MKKVIFALAAVVALAACSNEQTVSFDKGEAIGFDTFIENSTRAAYDGSYINATLASFQVYGTVTGTGEGEQTANIFNGVVVKKGVEGVGTNGWAYDVEYKQYWIPGNNYAFFAIADGNVANTTEVVKNGVNMPTSIKLYDASQQRDILTADASVVNYVKTTNSTNVPFTFKHIMSKAKFTFKNTIAVDTGYSYKVTNVEILNAPKEATYTITDGDEGTWVKSGNVVLARGERRLKGFSVLHIELHNVDFLIFVISQIVEQQSRLCGCCFVIFLKNSCSYRHFFRTL